MLLYQHVSGTSSMVSLRFSGGIAGISHSFQTNCRPRHSVLPGRERKRELPGRCERRVSERKRTGWRGDSQMRRPIKLLLPLAAALALVVFQALPALACGSLVAPNGAIRLARATTLVAWHGGVEQYMTSFTYQGDFSDVGWIVPLPTLPDKIQEGGAWTLQRLNRETHPIVADGFGLDNARAPQAASAAIVVQPTRVEALDIKVLKGSGPQVLNWCHPNNFFVNPHTPTHLRPYR